MYVLVLLVHFSISTTDLLKRQNTQFDQWLRTPDSSFFQQSARMESECGESIVHCSINLPENNQINCINNYNNITYKFSNM